MVGDISGNHKGSIYTNQIFDNSHLKPRDISTRLSPVNPCANVLLNYSTVR